ncbi:MULTISPECIES: thiamine/thiamine pyrophosphate ABC transporter permease [unclassified Marinobacter]|uniref:thiamine/thiamine pyrophosphate ABC transporter permease n=1 Tax=unclassified Marinobacter TaxID=83889 RepID=UPI0026E3A2FE|nr:MULTISPECIES: thiamine/thiamine pyrophosphate ABC transporter permease [unclassified Marinobacter]MDO6442222.1 thiamine/thiamine pyrophosphate ABC transporter permease [Marinobacter sp. 2_MG-2023]MDO6825012.1 thiamine/thiamine pyrophosphate ABC transporter permease [Marinobacter sp. 1_MG-2023]
MSPVIQHQRRSLPAYPAPLSHSRWKLWPGLTIAAALIVLSLAGLGALVWEAELPGLSEFWSNRYLRTVVTFTIWQAFLSVVLSLLVAFPVARILARQPAFPGRAFLLRLMELSLVLPSIVLVSGIISVYGRQGWFTGLANEWLGTSWNLYGINGIVLAHVFFNAPLAARILLQAIESAPASQRRVAAQLGLGRWWYWRAVEWPAVKPVLPGLAALVFTLCFTSFAIVMTLGGGPAATTIEVAIYQSLRFEFDAGQAALLAMVQLVICGFFWWLAARHGLTASLLPDRRVASHRSKAGSSIWARLGDGTALAVFVLFLVTPLMAILLRGLPGMGSAFFPDGTFSVNPALLDATLRSLGIAIPAGLMSVIAALLILASGTSQSRPTITRLSDVAAYLPLMVPPLVLGTGLFLLFRPSLGNSSEGLALVTLINAMMALPFVLQMLRGPMGSLDSASRMQADQLGVLGWYRWRWLHWPRMRRPLALAMAYGTGLSLGDFGVIALFGSPGQPTLPVLLYQQLGSYRIDAAAATGLWLVLLLLMLFSLFNRLGSPLFNSGLAPKSSRTVPEPEHA